MPDILKLEEKINKVVDENIEYHFKTKVLETNIVTILKKFNDGNDRMSLIETSIKSIDNAIISIKDTLVGTMDGKGIIGIIDIVAKNTKNINDMSKNCVTNGGTIKVYTRNVRIVLASILTGFVGFCYWLVKNFINHIPK